ncbi:MAG TPA: holo-ACP synthase [Microbacteriaceae bacterium]|nr:holo-ACP synthase [Microbacteriaceae bacterium]
MIIGIGVDTVDISRFERQITKTPKLIGRLFTPQEKYFPARSLAARFAAKEALIKAFGGSDDISWQDLEILKTGGSKPMFSNTLALTAKLNKLGAAKPHLSMSHDGNIATAFVVLESLELEAFKRESER